MKRVLGVALLSVLPLGCRAENPPMEPYAGTYPAEQIVTLRVGSDGSIQAGDKLLYDPRVGDDSALKAFLAAQQAQNPNVAVDLLAAPDVPPEMVEHLTKLAGEDMQGRGHLTFKIEGTVQTTFRTH